MEEKGYVTSYLGDPTAVRGGRAKRFYRLEAPGAEALNRNERTSSLFAQLLPTEGGAR
jgi:DNA-binding PadR family transcriptional regulator